MLREHLQGVVEEILIKGGFVMYEDAKNNKKKDGTHKFLDEYFVKYIAEITDFNKSIVLNDEDSSIFLAAITIVNDPEAYDAHEIVKALNIYDALAFYQACGLISYDANEAKFYIDPIILHQKVIEHNDAKDINFDDDKKVVSVYTKRA